VNNIYWQEHDPRVFARIHALLEHCRRSPRSGIGHPEPLRHDLAGWWSRRINKEHRLVSRVIGDVLEVSQCPFHYDD
jgi:toxin YoeB